jgi:16S rRNA (uracil1498-N3)-methyltransferase
MSPIKMKRMKIAVEKATECGVSSIIPVVTQNTNSAYDESDLDTLRKTIIQSAEQCERLTIPQLYSPISFQQFVDSWQIPSGTSPLSSSTRKLFVCRERSDDDTLSITQAMMNCYADMKAKHAASSNVTIGVFVGPEGGITTQEITSMQELDTVETVSLGETVLRSDTACIAAVSAANIIYHDYPK